MKIEEIMSVIRHLAESQGFYSRLYEGLWNLQEHDPERWAEVKEKLESQHFADSLDVVMYYEG